MKKITPLLLIFPLTVSAADCNTIINNIHADIKHYTTLISNQTLPWMKLSWLEKNLGKAHQIQTPGQPSKYNWQCTNGTYLTVHTDPQGNLTKVSGQYSTDQGSGVFYTYLKKS